MAERYSRIYTLPGNLYSENAPILIVAGALLKDNQTGKMLAQLKMQNLDERIVTGISLNFVLFNAEGEQIGEPFAYQFSRISLEENSFFGQKEPIILPAGEIYSYQVSIQNVILSGGKVWETKNTWKPLLADTSLADIKQKLADLRQKEAEEIAKELEEIQRLEEEKERKAKIKRAEKKKARKKTFAIICTVIALLVVLLVLLMPKPEKSELLSELINSSWQHHSYYKDIDWDYKETIKFVDDENIILVIDSSKSQVKHSEIPCSWKFNTISSEKAKITVKSNSGTTYKFTIFFQWENGEYEISKIVQPQQYSDDVYYRVR